MLVVSKINKIYNPPTIYIIGKRKKDTNQQRVQDEKGDITTNFTDIKRIIGKQCKQLYANKFNNSDIKQISYKTQPTKAHSRRHI